MFSMRFYLISAFLLFTLYSASLLADHASVGFGAGTGSPIGTETAVTLPQGKWTVGLRSEYINFDRASDQELRGARIRDPEGDIHSVDSLITTSIGAAYGVTDDLTIGLKIPYVVRRGIREPEHGHGVAEALAMDHDDDGMDHDDGGMDHDDGGMDHDDGGMDHDDGGMADHDDGAMDHDAGSMAGHDDGAAHLYSPTAGRAADIVIADSHYYDGGQRMVVDTMIETLGNADGLGDMILFGEYRFYHNSETKTHAAVLFGVKVPTGDTSARSRDGHRLETELQPGTGSWDGLLGLTFTQVCDCGFAIDSNLLYSVVTEGSQKTNMGDIFDYNVAVSYRIGGEAYDRAELPKSSNVWDLLLEVNGEWRAKQIRSGVADQNSGGNIIYLSPGIRYAGWDGWNAAFSVGYPIVKDLNGFQVTPNYRMIGTFNINF